MYLYEDFIHPSLKRMGKSDKKIQIFNFNIKDITLYLDSKTNCIIDLNNNLILTNISHDSFIFLLQENNDLEFDEIKRLSNYIYISFPGEYISQCIISTNTSNENLLKSIKSLRVYNIFYISLGLRNDKSNLLFNKSELSLNNVYQVY